MNMENEVEKKDALEIIFQKGRMFVIGEVRWGEKDQFKVHEGWENIYSIFMQLSLQSELWKRVSTTPAAADFDVEDV